MTINDIKELKLKLRYKRNLFIQSFSGLTLFCLTGESQIRCGEYLNFGRRKGLIAVNMPFDRRIQDCFVSLAGEICRPPGQLTMVAFDLGLYKKT